MGLQKRLPALLLVLMLLCALCTAAYAGEALDQDRQGSIQITMKQGSTVVGGGTLTLYRVGQVKEQDGGYSFALTGDFAGCGESLTDLSSADLAAKLGQYAKDHSLTGTTKAIDSSGKVSFPNLELGLYLLVQNEAAKGYHKVGPFLVSVPMNEDGAYLYDVDASPKVELKKETEPTPTTPTKPPESTLPQTGQLNWPVPVLVLLGLGLFSVGWVLRFGKRQSTYEK